MAFPQVTFQISSPQLSGQKCGSIPIKGNDETYYESLVNALKETQMQINSDLTNLINESETENNCKSNKGLKRSVGDDVDEGSQDDDDDAGSDKEINKKTKIS